MRSSAHSGDTMTELETWEYIKVKIVDAFVTAMTTEDDGKRDTSDQCLSPVIRALMMQLADGDTLLATEVSAWLNCVKNRLDPTWLNVDASLRESVIPTLIMMQQSLKGAKAHANKG